jgi:hypothetical protein
MRKMIFITIVFTCLTAPVLADYYGGRIYYNRIGGYYSGNGGEFTLRSDGGLGLLLSNSAYDAKTRGEDGNPESFQTFCVETAEYVAQPMDIVVSTTFVNEATGAITGPGSHAILGSKPFGDNLDPMTAYLYTKFAQGTLAGYNYTVGAQRVASAGALQNAIWFIEGEGGVNNAFVALANDAVTVGGNTDEWVGKGIGDVRILNTWVPGHIGELGFKTQDQLYLVPVPAAVLLGMLGLGVAGLKLRKSK